MNKIRIIDLLNKIANKEEVPKKIVYRGIEYEYVDEWEQYVVSNNQLVTAEQPLLETISRANYSCLNDEIEIIEESKKIDKKDLRELLQEGVSEHEYIMIDVIEQIIDKINEMENK